MLPVHSRVKSRIAWAVPFALLFTFVSCTPIRYHEIQAPSAALGSLKTYRWEAPALTSDDGKNAYTFDATFRSAIDSGLASKGYVPAETADLIVDYRISVVTRPGMDDSVYAPHWTRDNSDNLYFTGWEEPQGTGSMLEHGVVTLSLRATKAGDLLWEGGVSKLLKSGADHVDVTDAAQTAASALLKKVPSHHP